MAQFSASGGAAGTTDTGHDTSMIPDWPGPLLLPQEPGQVFPVMPNGSGWTPTNAGAKYLLHGRHPLLWQLNWLQCHCDSLDTSILHDLVDDLRGGLYRLNRSLPGLQGRPDLLRELLEYLVNLAALELVKEDEGTVKDNLAMLKWLRSSIVFPGLIVSRLDDGSWIVGDKIVPVINLATNAAANAINGWVNPLLQAASGTCVLCAGCCSRAAGRH